MFSKLTTRYIQHFKLIIEAEKKELKKAYLKKAGGNDPPPPPPFTEINSDFLRAFHLFESNKCPFN